VQIRREMGMRGDSLTVSTGMILNAPAPGSLKSGQRRGSCHHLPGLPI
jgi:hypothetical protein